MVTKVCLFVVALACFFANVEAGWVSSSRRSRSHRGSSLLGHLTGHQNHQAAAAHQAYVERVETERIAAEAEEQAATDLVAVEAEEQAAADRAAVEAEEQAAADQAAAEQAVTCVCESEDGLDHYGTPATGLACTGPCLAPRTRRESAPPRLADRSQPVKYSWL